VLVVDTAGAPAVTAPRRRRRPRRSEAEPDRSTLPLTRATAIRAFAPFEDAAEAARWLDEASEAEDTVDVLLGEAIALLNRALHAQAVAAADPGAALVLDPESAIATRIGWGSGEETAYGRHRDAREVDAGPTGSRRRRREQDLRPQERVAALLGGRERADACETLLLRARADHDAGRAREAALQLQAGLRALRAELHGAVADPGHDKDMQALEDRSPEADEAAAAALGGELTSGQVHSVRELLEVAERVLRRRRVLRGQ
jgi:hypothetical protein